MTPALFTLAATKAASWLQSTPLLGYLFLAIVLGLLGVQVLRFRSHFVRTWDAVDKRLSEVLWRTRNSDTQELRRRTDVMAQQMEETMEILRTLANTIDAQMELLRGELRSSLSKVDYVDSKKMGQQRLIVYQLERMRQQLDALQEPEVRRGGPSSRSSDSSRLPNRDAARPWSASEAAHEFLTQSGIDPRP